jgi:hypothetical protein
MRWFGVSGIPHAVLIDPSGTVVYRGGPSGITDSVVEDALVGALEVPMWEWPSSTKSIQNALRKRMFGKALSAAQALESEQGPAIVKAIEAQIAGRVKAIASAKESGDFLTVLELGPTYMKQLTGLPAADEVKELVTAVKSDRGAVAISKGQKKLAELEVEMAELRKVKDADKLIAKIEKLRKKHEGSIVDVQGQAMIDDIERRKEKLR